MAKWRVRPIVLRDLGPLPLALFGLTLPLLNLALTVFLLTVRPLPRSLAPAPGITTGIAGIYALAFVPVLPFAAVGVLIAGLGLMGFIPLAALWSTRRIGRQARPSGPLRKGVAASLVLFLIASTPALVVWTGYRLAQSGKHHRSGIAMLRRFGNRLDMVRYGCPGTESIADIWTRPLQWASPMSQSKARESFEEATGTSFELAVRETAPMRCVSSMGYVKSPAN